MKILVLSTIYTAPNIKIENNTNVVHYFAKEWVKQGHEVYVIHNYPIYLRIFHILASFASELIASKFNTSVTSFYQKVDYEYELDGVKVIRMPLFKPFPHGKVPKSSLNKQIQKIFSFCDKNNFEPDIITSHNFYPHLEMVLKLNQNYFKKAKTCVVVHKQNFNMLNFIAGKDYKRLIKNVDIWGYRSLPIKNDFESFIGLTPNYFMCYSGIPSHFLNRNDVCKIEKPINKFVYVGSFIKRKYPEKILSALQKTQIQDFYLSYVGDGVNRNEIEKIIKSYKWENKVHLYGFLQREKVPEIIAKHQCFVMISKEETFGLVYLEAMSMGCITIASKNEGMEGIIIDGENGFLCTAGDDDELASIINKINNLPENDLNRISLNAKSTAIALTDEKVAQIYVNKIVNSTHNKYNG